MSETDMQRLKLVGVGPNSRSMKFLNTKNNIADKRLKRQLLVIEKQKKTHLNVLEHEKIDAKHFLKTVRNLDHETQEAKTLLRKDDLISITPPPKIRKERQRRKIRLAQTAPAHMNHSDGNYVGSKADIERKMMKSGPETPAEKEKMLQIDKKKSIFLQLPGSGRNRYDSDDDTPRKRFALPKPSSKTLLDVMIGLNAFSFVPTPTHNSGEESRSETRSSFFERDSVYDSSENIAKKFISNWRNKIASRKQSIFLKLDKEVMEREKPLFRSDSIATSCIPEGNSLQNSFRKRKSKWTMRHSMRPTTLPTIDDEAERMEQFVQYVRESKEKEKQELHPAFTNCGEDKNAQRRKSFVNWLQERKENPREKHDFYDEDDEGEEELTYRGVSLQHKDVDLQPTDLGDLMKTILKIKTTFRDPLDSRVKRFLKELDKMKERDDAAQRTPSKKERKRRWIALTRGIDAALADSSDDEDYTYYNSY